MKKPHGWNNQVKSAADLGDQDSFGNPLPDKSKANVPYRPEHEDERGADQDLVRDPLELARTG